MRRRAWTAKTPVLVAIGLLLVVACQPQTVIVEKETTKEVVKETVVTEEVQEPESILFVVPRLEAFGQSTLEGLVHDFQDYTGATVDLLILD